jgi:hypothetical protein
MAELAGMSWRDRWSSWHMGAFSAESDGHVSVWKKVAS